ncbi:MAG: hypothetical protein ACUVWZ_16645 [Anaerolineae bacterium]
MRITVIPEQLRQVAQGFRQAQSGLEGMDRRLRTQLSALDWEIRRQQVIEEQIGQDIRLAGALAEGAGERASWLEAAAARSETIDREAYQAPGVSFGRLPVPSIPQILGVWTGGGAARDFPITRLIPDDSLLGGLGVFTLSATLLQPLGDLVERFWNWMNGHDWITDKEREAKKNPHPESNNNNNDSNVTTTNPPQEPPIDINAAREKLKQDPNMGSMWGQVEAPIRSVPGQRSPDLYSAVIDQFDVEHSHIGRYQPSEKYRDTRCNIFAGDVMRAMGAPLPTKEDFGKKGDRMTANTQQIHKALKEGWGGWRKIDVNNPDDLRLLQEHLKAGKPAVASDPGHIAVIRPNGLPDQLTQQNIGELHIAQAGKRNLNDVHLKDAGLNKTFQPEYFIHD